MTETCQTSTLLMPARRRPSTALPVLIQVPNIAVASRPAARKVRRRRLRKEVRIVGFALLLLFPISLACFTLGGDKLPGLAAPGLIVENPSDSPTEPASTISLAPLEPVITVQREGETPVILPGYLLPADAPEESSDGGH